MTIGFVLLTHAHPGQIVRLTRTLTGMFGPAPILCHHDFSRCALDLQQFAPNVSFLRPHLRTGWAEFSVVEATARCIEHLYGSGEGPDWFVVLSGADYPIQPAGTILADLGRSPYDAHISHQIIDRRALDPRWLAEYRHTRNVAVGEHPVDPVLCYTRYCAIRIPWISRQLQPQWRTVYRPQLAQLLTPFSARLACHAGSQWFCGSRRAAHAIMAHRRRSARLARHFRRRMFAEEAYFQTILVNEPQLRVSANNFRFTDWTAREPHPKTLDLADLPRVVQSGAHFARKMDPSSSASLLAALDARVLHDATAGQPRPCSSGASF